MAEVECILRRCEYPLPLRFAIKNGRPPSSSSYVRASRLTESVCAAAAATGGGGGCPAPRLAAVSLSSPPDRSGNGRGGAGPAAEHAVGGRRLRRASRERERPPHHRARPIRRRRAQQQGQREGGVREAGEGEAAGGGRVHALPHHGGEGRRRQEAVRGPGVGEGVGELQAAPGIQSRRRHRLMYIYHRPVAEVYIGLSRSEPSNDLLLEHVSGLAG